LVKNRNLAENKGQAQFAIWRGDELKSENLKLWGRGSKSGGHTEQTSLDETLQGGEHLQGES